MTNTNTVNIHIFFPHITSGVNQNRHLLCHTVSIREVYNCVYDCRSWKPIVATRRMPENSERNLDQEKKVSNVAEWNEVSSRMYVERKKKVP